MNATARHLRAWLSLLAILYATVVLAGLVAPYPPNEQNRNLPFAPPVRLHFVETTGRLHLRPFVYRLVSRPGTIDEYDEDRTDRYPVRFIVRGAPYRIAGILAGDRHLFGVAEPAKL